MQFQEEQDYTKHFDASHFDASLWKKLVLHARAQWRNMGLIALFMTVVAVCDALLPLMTRYAIDRFVMPRQTAGLGLFGGGYFVLVTVQAAAIFCFIYMAQKVEKNIVHTMRRKGFRKLQELPFSYYDRMPVGYLMSRMTSDIGHLGDALAWGIVQIAWALVFLTAGFISMFLINWRLTLAILLVIPPLALVSVYFQKRILEGHREVRKANSRITSAFNEGIMGAKTTKTLVREQLNSEEFHALTQNMQRLSLRTATLSAFFLPLVISLGSIATAYALTRGSSMVFTGLMTLGTVAAFVDYTVQLFQPIRELASVISELQRTQAAAERVVTLLETAPEIIDTPAVEAEYGDNFHPRRENWPAIQGEVTFEHVTFRYRDGEQVLTDFSLQVKAGQTIAIVGPTGAGKSTIVNLVCRFYEPTQGRILIDGHDYRERSQLWLQSNLGYVLQEPHLFSGTVADNIRYALPQASQEQVEDAARLVRAEEFILKLENGYDTQVGEGGSRLSTGEKQLISFARAILADPRIFVLDEATSSVDTQTEALIQQAIAATLKGRTSFIIAHRLSTVRSADRILVVENGRIAESGSHQELLAKKGFYYELYTNQFQEEKAQEVLGAAAVQ